MKILVMIIVNVAKKKAFRRYVKLCVNQRICIFIISIQRGDLLIIYHLH